MECFVTTRDEGNSRTVFIITILHYKEHSSSVVYISGAPFISKDNRSMLLTRNGGLSQNVTTGSIQANKYIYKT